MRSSSADMMKTIYTLAVRWNEGSRQPLAVALWVDGGTRRIELINSAEVIKEGVVRGG